MGRISIFMVGNIEHRESSEHYINQFLAEIIDIQICKEDISVLEYSPSRPSLLLGNFHHKLMTWKQKFDLPLFNWVVLWVVLPNFAFLPFWVIGGPPRFLTIAIFGLLGLLTRDMPRFVKFPVFAISFIVSIVMFICNIFDLRASQALMMLPFLTQLNIFQSFEYVAAGIASLGTLIAAWIFAGKSTRLSSKTAYVTALAILSLVVVIDEKASNLHSDAYQSHATADTPFSSATKLTNFVDLADGKTNLMIIMVESMGEPTDPILKQRLHSLWANPTIQSHYDVTAGTSPFNGSTTAAEMRELCFAWRDYAEIEDSQPNCLPNLLKSKGYKTNAYHAFEKDFFNRKTWYPLIGLDELRFKDTLLKHGAKECGAVWLGACDFDVPAEMMRDQRNVSGPQFTYWLTLNSHIPVTDDVSPKTKNCNQFGAAFDSEFPIICRQFAVWEETADAFTKMATAPDFPPTHILIIGDHVPPYFHAGSRSKFDGYNVPWILLKTKATAKPSEQQTLAKNTGKDG